MSDQLLSSPSRNLIDPLIYQNSPSVAKSANNNKDEPKPKQSAPIPIATGLTPYVSKTYFQDLSFSLTPHKDQGQVDYSQGLNLTPFLQANAQIPLSIGSNSINHQLSNITPFIDKTLQFGDFFIESPNKDVMEHLSGTPSKLASRKRQLSQVDTPPRPPHKLSISHKATPSRSGLRDITNYGLTPVGETPKRGQEQASSPSTLIVSSAVRQHQTDDEDSNPPSPTPQKEAAMMDGRAPPMMGTFQEQRKKKKPAAKPSNTKFQIVFTDVHTLMNQKKGNEPAKKKRSPQKQQAPPPPPPPHQQQQPIMIVPPYYPPVPHQMVSVPVPAPKHDNTMNTSKEVSMMSAHLNQTTEHTSFEMPGVSSTPNGKFILDRVFEKHSPQGYGFQGMPPPNSQSSQKGPLMMMSTPQHQSVTNYLYGTDMSPSADMPMFPSPMNFPVLNMQHPPDDKRRYE